LASAYSTPTRTLASAVVVGVSAGSAAIRRAKAGSSAAARADTSASVIRPPVPYVTAAR
jgi:hypothetical protein